MWELRWILLGMGVLLIAGVYVWSRKPFDVSFRWGSDEQERAEPTISEIGTTSGHPTQRRGTDKVVTLIDECSERKLKVLPPDINTSEYMFTVNGEATILYGLGAIKGAGESAIESILAERSANGAYVDMFDLCKRIDLRKANRRVLEALIRAGAFDDLGAGRSTLMGSLGKALQMAEQHLQNSQAGLQDMFGFEETSGENIKTHYEIQPEWNDDERLRGEKETLGLYLTGHPIEKYMVELKQFITSRLVDIDPSREQNVLVAGLIVAMQVRNTRRGDRIAFITLDDRSARREVVVYSEEYQRFQHLLAKDKLLVLKGTVGTDEYSNRERFKVDEIYDIDQARNRFVKQLVISVDAEQAGNGFVGTLATVLKPFCEGSCPVAVTYRGGQAQAILPLGKEWNVQPTDTLLQRLRDLTSPEQVRLVY